MQCLLNKDHQHLKWQQQKYWMLLQDYWVVTDKQLTPCQDTLRQSWRMLPDGSEFQSQGVQIFGHVFFFDIKKWQRSWSNIEDPVVLFERNLCGHPLAVLSWERQFEEVLMELGWVKVANWECLFVHRKQGLFYFVFVDDIGWKEAEHVSHVEEIDEQWSWRTDIISWPRILGVYPTWMQTKRNNCWTI